MTLAGSARGCLEGYVVATSLKAAAHSRLAHRAEMSGVRSILPTGSPLRSVTKSAIASAVLRRAGRTGSRVGG